MKTTLRRVFPCIVAVAFCALPLLAQEGGGEAAKESHTLLWESANFVILAAGLAWYAWRRARESAAALQRSRDWESRTAQLLAHNRVLAQQVLTAQERERLELARELHDEMGQCCNAISVEAAVIAQCVP